MSPDKRKKPVWMSFKTLKSVRKREKHFPNIRTRITQHVKRTNHISQKELKNARRNREKKLAANIKQNI